MDRLGGIENIRLEKECKDRIERKKGRQKDKKRQMKGQGFVCLIREQRRGGGRRMIGLGEGEGRKMKGQTYLGEVPHSKVIPQWPSVSRREPWMRVTSLPPSAMHNKENASTGSAGGKLDKRNPKGCNARDIMTLSAPIEQATVKVSFNLL